MGTTDNCWRQVHVHLWAFFRQTILSKDSWNGFCNFKKQKIYLQEIHNRERQNLELANYILPKASAVCMWAGDKGRGTWYEIRIPWTEGRQSRHGINLIASYGRLWVPEELMPLNSYFWQSWLWHMHGCNLEGVNGKECELTHELKGKKQIWVCIC